MSQGYLVNWELEKEIWQRALRGGLSLAPASHGIVLTEPMFNFDACREATQQMVFEEFGFHSMFVAPGGGGREKGCVCVGGGGLTPGGREAQVMRLQAAPGLAAPPPADGQGSTGGRPPARRRP